MAFAELLTSGKLFLYLTSGSLLLGQSLLSAGLSAIAIYMILAATATSTTKNLEKWLLIGILSLFVSVGSFGLQILANQDHDWLETFELVAAATFFQMGMGSIVAVYMLRDIQESKKNPPEDDVRFHEVTIKVLRGRDLVAKDRDFWGHKTTSDPYVVLHHGPHQLGKTAIIKKTLDPEWEEEIFRAYVLPRALDAHKVIELNIYDHDNLSHDDAMGTVWVPIPKDEDVEELYWYPVEKGTGENFCRNATGELLVSAKYSR